MSDILIMFLGMFGAFLVPLSLALWRYWSRMRPRVMAVRFDDQQAFLYRLTEALGKLGFRRAAGSGDPLIFTPSGLQKLAGAFGVTVAMPAAGTARITASDRVMRNVKSWFPDAREEPYSGPSPAGHAIRNLLKVYAGVVVIFGLLFGGVAIYERQTAGSGGGKDIEQTLELTQWEADNGVERNVPIEKTGKIFSVKVPPGSKTGTRLRLRGKGIRGGLTAAGDLYIIISVK